jgi:hypothetical protein
MGRKKVEIPEEVMENPIIKAQAIMLSVSPLASEASVERMKDLPVTNDDQQKFAVELLEEVKEMWRTLEDQRTQITGPMNKALRATNELFRPALKSLEHEEGLLKAKIADYLKSKELANVEALQLAAQASTPEQANQAISTFAPVVPPTGISVRYVWRFTVTQPELVPHELCSPDPEKIKAYSAAYPGAPIPGVTFTQESIVTSRAR